MIAGAAPALILVNGAAALEAELALDSRRVELKRVEYPSVDRPVKRLWHAEGWYRAGDRAVPLVAFPFLRKPRTHNSYAEIDQLGLAARHLVESS